MSASGLNFNPLPPCGGRPSDIRKRVGGLCISIHSLRVEGDFSLLRNHGEFHISIHSLRVEGDQGHKIQSRRTSDFNPLPPCGGRLQIDRLYFVQIDISIHSLRVEGDTVSQQHVIKLAISIHSLRVEGDVLQLLIQCQQLDFNPLPPCGGRPHFVAIGGGSGTISIHSLRVEGDGYLHIGAVTGVQFQSTPSVWRETLC